MRTVAFLKRATTKANVGTRIVLCPLNEQKSEKRETAATGKLISLSAGAAAEKNTRARDDDDDFHE